MLVDALKTCGNDTVQLTIYPSASYEIFHAAFAGRHSGPLAVENGRVPLRILVDRSSVEVFGGDGRTVISDRIFPRPTSRGVALFAEGGTAKVVSLRAWPLAPAIRR